MTASGRIIGATIALCVGAEQDFGLRSADQKKLDDLLAVPLSGASSDRKAQAYRALFEPISPTELHKLTFHPYLSLALQARFEELCAPLPPDPRLQKGDIVVPRPNLEFETFFARRVGYAPPKWWAIGFRVPPGPYFGAGFRSSDSPVRSILPKGLWRKDSGDMVTVSDALHRITFPKPVNGNALYVLFAGNLAYVESNASYAAYPSILTAYETSSGKKLWEQPVWGNYTGGFAGEGVHVLAMEIHYGQIVVYGVSPGSYAEGFQQSDGKPVFRFSTTYWWHSQEQWRLPWRKASKD